MRSVYSGSVSLSYRGAGGHLHHRDVHLANVGVQAAQFLERAAAVHALEEWHAFILKEDKKLLVLLSKRMSLLSMLSSRWSNI